MGFTGEISRILNMLGQSTGDVYLFYDFKSGLVHFSENMLAADDIFSVEKTVCSLGEWRQGVDSRDLQRLSRTMDSLVRGKNENYNLNYRVKNKKGHSSWINSRGQACYGKDGQPEYVLGRLSGNAFADRMKSFHTKELKREIRGILEKMDPGYLLIVGVDGMREINLKKGREFGDALLRDMARIMADETCHERRIYRISGDEFAVNCLNATEEEVKQLFGCIQVRLAGQCTVSGGCVSYTDYYVTDEEVLLQYAEVSLDDAKSRGKHMLAFFSPENYEDKLRELELREDLQQSIESGFEGFNLHYQAQFSAETYELYGAEALLRYRSPRRGNVPPEEFVPVLERGDLIYPVGLWVIEKALACCRRWREREPEFHISVNMSYSQLSRDIIEEDVLELVRQSGLPGSALTVEVTESMRLSNYPHLNGFFRRWKQAGIAISVDDFGTGYSSLGRLKEMEVDEIKIDRCFVSGIQNSAYNCRLLGNIIELARDSSIRVCCEGMETREELEVLEDLRSDLFQGFFFAKPCAAEEFEKTYIGRGAGEIREGLPGKRPLSIKAADRREDSDPQDEAAEVILNAEDDVFYLCDLDTYELYYLNPAGKRMFGVKNYRGKKCYRVLYGKSAPCPFCTSPLLRRDSFYVWEMRNEYCGRYFLLKGKVVNYRGRKARMEVALDITKQEYVSQRTRERLEFADRIAGYVDTLAANLDYEEAVNRALALAGEFYRADRAYLFERSRGKEGCWDNTFEWCSENAAPQIQNLQDVPPAAVGRWMELFAEGKSVILLNPDAIQQSSPAEWKSLKVQKIQRLIAVPIREEGRTIGFVGVDNPRYCIHDDSQMRALCGILLMRIRQERGRTQMPGPAAGEGPEASGKRDDGFPFLPKFYNNY